MVLVPLQLDTYSKKWARLRRLVRRPIGTFPETLPLLEYIAQEGWRTRQLGRKMMRVDNLRPDWETCAQVDNRDADCQSVFSRRKPLVPPTRRQTEVRCRLIVCPTWYSPQSPVRPRISCPSCLDKIVHILVAFWRPPRYAATASVRFWALAGGRRTSVSILDESGDENWSASVRAPPLCASGTAILCSVHRSCKSAANGTGIGRNHVIRRITRGSVG